MPYALGSVQPSHRGEAEVSGWAGATAVRERGITGAFSTPPAEAVAPPGVKPASAFF